MPTFPTLLLLTRRDTAVHFDFSLFFCFWEVDLFIISQACMYVCVCAGAFFSSQLPR